MKRRKDQKLKILTREELSNLSVDRLKAYRKRVLAVWEVEHLTDYLPNQIEMRWDETKDSDDLCFKTDPRWEPLRQEVNRQLERHCRNETEDQ